MYLPIQLDLTHRKVVIVGGGHVALEKAQKLQLFGIEATVVSETFLPEFQELENMSCVQATYEPLYLENAFFVIAATNQVALNHDIAAYCENNHILYNVVDDAAFSNVIFPASLKRGDLMISVSTSGNSPYLAKDIIRGLEATYDESYANKVALMGAIRALLKSKEPNVEKRRARLKELIHWDLDELSTYLERLTGEGDD